MGKEEGTTEHFGQVFAQGTGSASCACMLIVVVVREEVAMQNFGNFVSDGGSPAVLVIVVFVFILVFLSTQVVNAVDSSAND
mmetsp:Transcript_39646/g.61871  ORF Transcript_39646/g.61871 Transcript_39646/m.61871 type:complete len:82 (+) Transcript_39646:977-1222(+)